MITQNYSQLPFTAITYLTGECNYGGWVTDDFDRWTLLTLLKDFYNDKVLKGDYWFSPIKDYYIL